MLSVCLKRVGFPLYYVDESGNSLFTEDCHIYEGHQGFKKPWRITIMVDIWRQLFLPRESQGNLSR